MHDRKRTYIYLILLLISAFGLWSIVLDFSRFLSLNYEYDIYPSAVLKRINVILAAVIAWRAGRDSLSLTDSNIMKAAFMIICFAEGAFILCWRITGICFFAICQILLIIRNSAGLRRKLKYASHIKMKRLFLSGFTIFLIPAAMIILFGSSIKLYTSALIVFFYGIVLSTSLWTGLANYILGLLPRRNSNMVAAGMICFYCCDVLVGFDSVLEPGLPWLLANSFIWIFYIPALVLLALSCYTYNENKKNYIDKRTNVLHNITRK